MKKSLIIALIVAVAMIIIGAVISVLAIGMVKGDFNAFSTVTYEEKIYEITEDFDSISIDESDCEIIFARSENNICKVECAENENSWHEVGVKDGTLCITAFDKPMAHIGIISSRQPMMVYLPKDKYDKLTIDSSSGGVNIPEDFTFTDAKVNCTSGSVKFMSNVVSDADINSTSGSVAVSGLTCENLDVSSTSGSVKVGAITAADSISLSATSGSIGASGLNAANNLTIKNSSGSIVFDKINAGALTVSASSGRIEADDVNADGAEFETTSGSVTLNGTRFTGALYVEATSGGTSLTDTIADSMKVTSSSGSIKLNGCDGQDIILKASSGSIKGNLLTGKVFSASSTSGSIKVPEHDRNGGSCVIETTSGSINITVDE